MTKGLPRSLSRGGHLTRQNITKQTITINGSMDITGVAATVDAGTFVIGGLPEGNILFLGAVANIIVDAGADTSVIDDWTGDFGIGTIPNANVDLADAGDDDIIPSTALTADTGTKATLQTRGASTGTEGGVTHDNTAGTLELNFNLLIDDNVITDTEVGTFAVTGELYLTYIVLGDD